MSRKLEALKKTLATWVGDSGEKEKLHYYSAGEFSEKYYLHEQVYAWKYKIDKQKAAEILQKAESQHYVNEFGVSMNAYIVFKKLMEIKPI